VETRGEGRIQPKSASRRLSSEGRWEYGACVEVSKEPALVGPRQTSDIGWPEFDPCLARCRRGSRRHVDGCTRAARHAPAATDLIELGSGLRSLTVVSENGRLAWRQAGPKPRSTAIFGLQEVAGGMVQGPFDAFGQREGRGLWPEREYNLG
jgi:hypothetical protein